MAEILATLDKDPGSEADDCVVGKFIVMLSHY